MSYIALYRKYRPDNFDSIVGQENVIKILKNQIKLSKVSHAYIFSGSRGTGKTTAARIFARAINCENPHNGEPCNECKTCRSILDSSTTDVVEMDAASNNSVENIRQIRQEVTYATIDTKYRVYIIDEAHMLTTSAFNALLKTLEEPPENVIFILATTEVHKIPITILSRCIKFEFNKIGIEDISKRLKFVLESEKIEYENIAIEYIAKISDGAMRDALSILDRCVTEVKDKLTLELVENIVGTIDNKIIEEIVKDIVEYDGVKAVENIEAITKKGKDIREIAYRLSEKFLEILVDVNKDKMSEHNISNKRVISIIDKLSKLDADIKSSTRPLILLKSSIIEICNAVSENNSNKNEANETVNMLLKKIENLENEINKIKQNQVTKEEISIIKEKVKDINDNKKESVENKIQETKEVVKNKRIDTKQMIKDMKLEPLKEADELKNTICLKGKISIYSALASANILSNNKEIVIFTNTPFAYSKLSEDESIEEINKTLSEKLNLDKEVKICLNDEAGNTSCSKIEEALTSLSVDYTKID